MFRRSTIHKTIIKNKRKRMQKLNNTQIIHTTSQQSWKWLGFISIGMMLAVILLIPTIIVMLPIMKTTTPADTEVIAAQTENISMDALEIPSFDVMIKRSKTGEIETVPLETYVTSVVASEMPAEFEVEALKAQATAARTYVINHILHHGDGPDAVMSDTEEHQVYQNMDELKTLWGQDYHWKMEKLKKAVAATANEIITYEEEPITPTFFSMSNGYTEDAENYWGNETPYLKSVESKWEESNPKFTEQTVFSLAEVAQKIGINLPASGTIPIHIERTKSNRVAEINLNGTVLTGREVRDGLGLRSNDFSVQQKNDHLIFTTKGFGHGVGMSQYGANGMAKEGKTYKEILQYYYQNVEITPIKQAAPTLVTKK